MLIIEIFLIIYKTVICEIRSLRNLKVSDENRHYIILCWKLTLKSCKSCCDCSNHNHHENHDHDHKKFFVDDICEKNNPRVEIGGGGKKRKRYKVFKKDLRCKATSKKGFKPHHHKYFDRNKRKCLFQGCNSTLQFRCRICNKWYSYSNITLHKKSHQQSLSSQVVKKPPKLNHKKRQPRSFHDELFYRNNNKETIELLEDDILDSPATTGFPNKNYFRSSDNNVQPPPPKVIGSNFNLKKKIETQQKNKEPVSELKSSLNKLRNHGNGRFVDYKALYNSAVNKLITYSSGFITSNSSGVVDSKSSSSLKKKKKRSNLNEINTKSFSDNSSNSFNFNSYSDNSRNSSNFNDNNYSGSSFNSVIYSSSDFVNSVNSNVINSVNSNVIDSPDSDSSIFNFNFGVDLNVNYSSDYSFNFVDDDLKVDPPPPFFEKKDTNLDDLRNSLLSNTSLEESKISSSSKSCVGIPANTPHLKYFVDFRNGYSFLIIDKTIVGYYDKKTKSFHHKSCIDSGCVDISGRSIRNCKCKELWEKFNSRRSYFSSITLQNINKELLDLPPYKLYQEISKKNKRIKHLEGKILTLENMLKSDKKTQKYYFLTVIEKIIDSGEISEDHPFILLIKNFSQNISVKTNDAFRFHNFQPLIRLWLLVKYYGGSQVINILRGGTDLEKKNEMLFPVPSTRTLQKYAPQATYGLNKQLIQYLYDIRNTTKACKYVLISYDEIDIRAGLVYNPQINQIMGTENLLSEAEFDELEKGGRLIDKTGKKMCQFFLTTLDGKVCCPVGCWVRGNKTRLRDFLKRKLKDIIIPAIESQTNFEVIASSSDGDKDNELVEDMVTSMKRDMTNFARVRNNIFAKSTNLEKPKEPRHLDFYHLFDYIHLVKSLRNNLLQSKTKKFLMRDNIQFSLKSLAVFVGKDSVIDKLVNNEVYAPTDTLSMKPILDLINPELWRRVKILSIAYNAFKNSRIISHQNKDYNELINVAGLLHKLNPVQLNEYGTQLKSLVKLGEYVHQISEMYYSFHNNNLSVTQRRNKWNNVSKYLNNWGGGKKLSETTRKNVLRTITSSERLITFANEKGIELMFSALGTNICENFFSIIRQKVRYPNVYEYCTTYAMAMYVTEIKLCGDEARGFHMNKQVLHNSHKKYNLATQRLKLCSEEFCKMKSKNKRVSTAGNIIDSKRINSKIQKYRCERNSLTPRELVQGIHRKLLYLCPVLDCAAVYKTRGCLLNHLCARKNQEGHNIDNEELRENLMKKSDEYRNTMFKPWYRIFMSGDDSDVSSIAQNITRPTVDLSSSIPPPLPDLSSSRIPPPPPPDLSSSRIPPITPDICKGTIFELNKDVLEKIEKVDKDKLSFFKKNFHRVVFLDLEHTGNSGHIFDIFCLDILTGETLSLTMFDEEMIFRRTPDGSFEKKIGTKDDLRKRKTTPFYSGIVQMKTFLIGEKPTIFLAHNGNGCDFPKIINNISRAGKKINISPINKFRHYFICTYSFFDIDWRKNHKNPDLSELSTDKKGVEKKKYPFGLRFLYKRLLGSPLSEKHGGEVDTIGLFDITIKRYGDLQQVFSILKEKVQKIDSLRQLLIDSYVSKKISNIEDLDSDTKREILKFHVVPNASSSLVNNLIILIKNNININLLRTVTKKRRNPFEKVEQKRAITSNYTPKRNRILSPEITSLKQTQYLNQSSNINNNNYNNNIIINNNNNNNNRSCVFNYITNQKKNELKDKVSKLGDYHFLRRIQNFKIDYSISRRILGINSTCDDDNRMSTKEIDLFSCFLNRIHTTEKQNVYFFSLLLQDKMDDNNFFVNGATFKRKFSGFFPRSMSGFEKLVIPIFYQPGGMNTVGHFLWFVVDLTTNTIHYYDSLPNYTPKRYVDQMFLNLKRVINYEFRFFEKEKQRDFLFIRSVGPIQTGSIVCGFFTVLGMVCTAFGKPLDYSMNNIDEGRYWLFDCLYKNYVRF